MIRSLTSLMREVASYGNRPEKDTSSPITFSDIASQYCPAIKPLEGDPVAGMAHFAEMGYCPYKAYHRGRGTTEEQTTGAKAALQRGTDYHNKREAIDRLFLSVRRGDVLDGRAYWPRFHKPPSTKKIISITFAQCT
jgi:hypothetical protein